MNYNSKWAIPAVAEESAYPSHNIYEMEWTSFYNGKPSCLGIKNRGFL